MRSQPAQGLQPLDQQLVNATFFKGSVGNDVKDVTCNALEGGCEMFFFKSPEFSLQAVKDDDCLCVRVNS